MREQSSIDLLLTLHSATIFFSVQLCVFVCLFELAPEVPVMSVPVVGFSFKPKRLALVTPLFHRSGYGEGSFYTRAREGTN